MAFAGTAAPMLGASLADLEPSPRRARSELTFRAAALQTYPEGGVGVRSASSLTFLPQEGDASELSNALFPDPVKMKEMLRKQMCKEEYRVETLYRSDGFWQRLARSSKFEKITFFAIFINAIWIGYDTEVNDYVFVIEAPKPYFTIENLFCAFFTFEIVVRFLSFRQKKDCLTDCWFRFDAFLVLLMVLETWVLTLVLVAAGYHSGDAQSRIKALSTGSALLQMGKLVRLTRLARMLRLVRVFSEALIMINGMSLAVRAVVMTLCMLFVLMYVFGIMFKELSQGTRCGEEHFGHLAEAMVTLLVGGTMLDNLTVLTNDLLYDMLHNGAWYLFVMFYVYIFLSALTVLNMLIGVVCETVSTIAAIEREQTSIHMVKSRLHCIIREAHPEAASLGSPTEQETRLLISREDFRVMLERPEAVQSLADVGVVAEDSGTVVPSLTVSDFIELILRLRGSNWATVKDLVETRRFVCAAIHSLERHVLELPNVRAGGQISEPGTRRSSSQRQPHFQFPPRSSTERGASSDVAAAGLDSAVQRQHSMPAQVGRDSFRRSSLVSAVELSPLFNGGRKASDAVRSEREDSLGQSLAAKASEVEEAIRAAQQSFSGFIQAATAEAATSAMSPFPAAVAQEKNGRLLQLAEVARAKAVSDHQPQTD